MPSLNDNFSERKHDEARTQNSATRSNKFVKKEQQVYGQQQEPDFSDDNPGDQNNYHDYDNQEEEEEYQNYHKKPPKRNFKQEQYQRDYDSQESGRPGIIREVSRNHSRASRITPQSTEFDEPNYNNHWRQEMNRSRSSSRNEVRNRCREQEEKLNELRANIISVGHNIKKSKNLINETRENSLTEYSQTGITYQDEPSFRATKKNVSYRNEFERDHSDYSSDYHHTNRKAGYVYRTKEK